MELRNPWLTVFASLAVGCLAPRVRADAVVIVGTFWRWSMLNPDEKMDKDMQKTSVCMAIQGAQALGHEVVLLTPNITCGGKVVRGRCAKGGECAPAEIQRELNSLSARMAKGKKENLLIQTVGHGSQDNTPSYDENSGPGNNDLGIGVDSLSAKKLADMINRSGLTAKARQIRGLWTQCYSGGWHEMANLLSPSGKFCAVAQSPHHEVAKVGGLEIEKLGGPGFVRGFWDTQRETRGTASLHESTVRAAHTQMLATGKAFSRSDSWVPSSTYLAEKATNTGEFHSYISLADANPTQPPKAYFSDGYDIDRLAFYRAFTKATAESGEDIRGIRERYEKHLKKVTNFNDERWFFQDEQKASNSFLYRSQTCQKNFESPLTAASRDLVRSMERIRDKIESEEYAGIRSTLGKKLAEWEKDRFVSEKLLLPEMKTYQQKSNALLERSGKLKRGIELPSTIPFTTRNKWEAEYGELGTEFEALARLDAYPQLRKQLMIEKQVRQIEALIRLIEDKKVDPVTKERILTTWECESTPVFSSKGGGS